MMIARATSSHWVSSMGAFFRLPVVYLRHSWPRPRLFRHLLVHGDELVSLLDRLSVREFLDEIDSQDPVVDPPEPALLEAHLLLLRCQDALILQHVEDIAVLHLEQVVNDFSAETEE